MSVCLQVLKLLRIAEYGILQNFCIYARLGGILTSTIIIMREEQKDDGNMS